MPAETMFSSDVEAMVSGLTDQFGLQVPELIEGAISLTAEEAQADVTGDILFGAFGPGPHYAPGMKVTYYVPFSGPKQMFDCKPSSWGGNIPVAEVGDNELTITFVRPGQDVAALRAVGLPQQYPQAQFYLWLEENNYLAQVRSIVEAGGKKWENELNNLYVSPLIAKAILKCDSNFAVSEAAARDTIKTLPALSEHSRTRPEVFRLVSLLSSLPCCSFLVEAEVDVIVSVGQTGEPRKILLVTQWFSATVFTVGDLGRHAQDRALSAGRLMKLRCKPWPNVQTDTIV